MLAISRVSFLWVGRLLAFAGLVLVVRGLIGSALISVHARSLEVSPVERPLSYNRVEPAGGRAKTSAPRRRTHAEEFKEFAMRGNVIDLAVGVIIGAAFGKIVASLVDDIIMPPIGACCTAWIFRAYS